MPSHSGSHVLVVNHAPEILALMNELLAEAGYPVSMALLRITDGRVIAKLGAEGLLCLAIPDYQLGIAIRDICGSS